eukprot:PhF_6_TR5988/c0_g1_i1/m.8643
MGPSQSAPHWKADNSSNYCEICLSKFTMNKRRHHCRSCGGLFCNKCSDYKKPVPTRGYDQPVRVCMPCYRGEKGALGPGGDAIRSPGGTLTVRRLSLPAESPQHTPVHRFTEPSSLRSPGHAGHAGPLSSQTNQYSTIPINTPTSPVGSLIPKIPLATVGSVTNANSVLGRAAPKSPRTQAAAPVISSNLQVYLQERKASGRLEIPEKIALCIASFGGRVFGFVKNEAHKEALLAEEGAKCTFPSGGMALIRPLIDVNQAAQLTLRITQKGNSKKVPKSRGTQIGLVNDSIAKQWRVVAVGSALEDIHTDVSGGPLGISASGFIFGGNNRGSLSECVGIFSETPCIITVDVLPKLKELRFSNSETQQGVRISFGERPLSSWGLAVSAGSAEVLTFEVLE